MRTTFNAGKAKISVSLIKYILHFAVIFIYVPSFSQKGGYNVSSGLSFSIAGKAALVNKDPGYAVFGAMGLYSYLFIGGTEENGLSLYLKGGVQLDQTKYTVQKGNHFNAGLFNAIIHPQIAFPSKYPNFKFLFGFGLNINLSTDVSISSNQSNNYRIDIEGTKILIQQNVRPVIPFFSAGVMFTRFRRTDKFFLDFFIKQTLINTYRDPVAIPYYSNLSPNIFYINKYMPLTAGITFGFRIL